jgi:hypothetical protein
MANLFPILNQFVKLFRKNVIEKSFMNWRVLQWLKLTHVFQINPALINLRKKNVTLLLSNTYSIFNDKDLKLFCLIYLQLKHSFFNIGCFFKFHLVVGVEESIVNAPLV